MSLVKFVNVVDDLRKFMKSLKHGEFNKNIDKVRELINNIYNIDKTKPIKLYKRTYINKNDKDLYNNPDYLIINNILINKKETEYFNSDNLITMMADYFSLLETVYNCDLNEDIYEFCGRLFNVPGFLVKEEIEQIYCIV